MLTFLQVILRYVFNTGLLWALEATLYMFGWLVLIGISYGIRTHSHIGIDLLAQVAAARAAPGARPADHRRSRCSIRRSWSTAPTAISTA